MYSTCTISEPENEGQLAAAAELGLERVPARRSDLPAWDHERVDGVMQTLPHRDGTDGFFVARWVKRA